MKRYEGNILRAAFIVCIGFAAINMASCQNMAGNKPAAAVAGAINKSVSTDEFDQKLQAAGSGAQLIDVRTPGEFEGGHLKNARNININSDDFETQINTLDKNKPVYVYCLSGGRSSNAASKMQDMGFKEVYNMAGGVMKWRSANKHLETGASAGTGKGITQDEFNKLVAKNKYVLVDYNAVWCKPCQKMMPVLERFADARKEKLSLLKIDVDANKDFATSKGISAIPYLELYQDGKLIWRHEGALEEDELMKETKL